MKFESLNNWLSEEFGKDVTFNQLFRIKNKWVPVQQADKNDLVDSFFELVNIAYSPIGGHLKVNGPEDLKREDCFYLLFFIDRKYRLKSFGKELLNRVIEMLKNLKG